MIYQSLRYAVLVLLLGNWATAHTQTLVWEENFDAAAVNPTTWTYDFGDGCERNLCGWGNSELEYYTSRTENARIEDGKLIIEARREAFLGKQFTSARLKTEGRVHFKYGTVEARIKLPNLTRGVWPAFWTLGTIGGSWPSIGEIDMMEVGSAQALAANLGNQQVSAAAHWSNATGAHEYNVFHTNAAVDLSLDYHLYKMVWTSQHIKMYVDNVEFYTFDISGGAAANVSEFHEPHFLLLNVAVGGQYTGIYTEGGITAPFPAKMYVDYIKLYQNPGDVLYLGDNNAFSGKYGVLTDNTPVNAALNYGTDAELYYWNNLTPIPNAVPFEGSNVWAVRANANNWFGMGVENQYKNLINFANGSLNFKFKTTYQGQFKIGVKTGHGESWINFAAGTTDFGLQRNGTWSTVKIPLSNFQNPSLGRNVDWKTLKNAFMFAGEAPSSLTDFYFDDMYYTDVTAVNPAPSVSITAPTNGSTFTPLSTISIAADAIDADGTITKVEFYQGTTLLATDFTSPYTHDWANVPIGYYSLTAKATDNDNNVSTSSVASIAVSPAACTGIATSGDYSYEVFTNAGTAYFKFRPLSPITGSNACIIYVREGGGGTYPGYPMTAFGSDFIFSKAIANGTTASFYFTYNVPSGGERNSSAAPHSYTVGSTGTNCSGGGGGTSTFNITAAPTPTRSASSVISLFSNAYTNRTVDTWSATWDNADVTDTTITGNNTKIYSNLTFAGIEFTSSVINATAMTHFHIDIWTPNSSTFKVKLVDFGADGVYAGGDDKEHELSFTPALNGWVSYDLPLSNFTNMTTRAHLAQLILVGSNSKVYVDNIYLYDNTVIPVELTTFKAKLSNNTTVLDWQTASERNNKAFDIERSSEGTTYNAIGQVKGNGTTNTPHNYTFTDKDPITGINYYRLRQTDFDGKQTISKQISIVFSKSGIVVKTTLNSNTIDVAVMDDKTRTLSIYNMAGQQVLVEKIQGYKILNINDLSNGVYIIRTEKGETARFVKGD